MSGLWTSAEAAAATGGRATRAFAATGLSIDTRTLAPGDLFVALKDLRDGHDFVRAALDKGAAAALVSRVPEGCSEADPLLIVADVLAALTALGQAGRARARAKVIAVTGSVGKTSTKEMLRAVLAGQGRVHAAEASFNNHWGVPVTLARMPADADFAVVEIGMNHPGEIAPLARLARPHVAMITTVAPAHLEAFESLEGIAREKAAIFQGLEPGGIAVIPSGLAVTPILAAAAAGGARTLRFGAEPGDDYRITDVTLAQDTTIVRATRHGAPLLFKVQTAGRHFAANALGVLAVAEAVGADPAVAAIDIGRWRPPAGRGQRQRIYMDIVDDAQSFDLIDDAFNANPASMDAALEVLGAAEPRDGIGRIKGGRRIAVLGDMLELGPTEADLHRAIARHPAMERIQLVHCVGPRMRALWDCLPRAKRGEWHETAADLAARAYQIADAGDVLLVKGSKGSKVSLVVDALRKLGQPGAAEARGTE
ncbi:MAG: UDP-N-acetylmuramoyl-tripeptide--D-alanyl-D-alanine ligase [Albidovulum sp.]|jgi:UDP-N-acetylmuramoyl-tripeptide--D-alanyl-D-alanine ligase|uniref:UDP-N-acetylmuramoyl-tripeptide--D-alanyl-D- alanine ligase n=1 Tax=Albidovulum sp. TaxID=1872424 RepID=UPI00132154F4|nr:UDP-N-acetylmuramoyl-tripeptide--D-alanyl-D-alanine ligase [Defluviimonas sp.]KAB2885045.1 MAG: UDP-N-acetylmuramoyl-tripeptide--D-alanyl-D-alanine ligase [Defluviimonas sp.]